jgi:hypothetical protein
MGNLQLKDRVCLIEDNNRMGMIVQSLGRGKFKVLWDRDWETGRTYVYNTRQIQKAS